MARSLTTSVALLCAMLVSVLFAAGSAWAQENNQPPAGFTALFNGQDIDGWKGGSTVDPRQIKPEQQEAWDRDIAKHWRVEDGELVNDGHPPHLVTPDEYGDFEMWVDWKLRPLGDSGIYLRGCPQVQIWDPHNEAVIPAGADKGSGGLWNNKTHERFPTELADKPIGQWNRMYIRMVGQYVTVKLNDKKIVDNVVLENYYDRKIPVFFRGPIHLQTHGSETRFRNVFVRKIPYSEADKILAEIRGGNDGFDSLFNGKDLAGWIGATDNYEIADGAIRCKSGKGGNLLTEQEYDNFVVRLEFKLPPGGNNGLAIRTPLSVRDPAYKGLELQVLDNTAEKYAHLHDYQFHGSVYGLAPALRGYQRPVGQWNYEEAVVDGDHIQVFLNGFPILDTHLDEIRKQPVDGKEHPGASRKTGHFGFCGHHDPVEFRYIRIKRLEKN